MTDSGQTPLGQPTGGGFEVVLLGNYLPDELESMNRFARMMHHALREAGIKTTLAIPESKLCKHNAHRGLSKWLAYFDKYLIFPTTTLRRLGTAPRSIIHICDHSNAVYTRFLRGRRTLVTCHDVIPILSAHGQSVDCPVSRLGRHLQRDILRGLGLAGRIACVSEATRASLLGLRPDWAGRASVVHSALNAPFSPVEVGAALDLISRRGISPRPPFLLHVGSNLERKNRPLLLRLMQRLGPSPYSLVVAGRPLDDSLQRMAEELGVSGQVVNYPNPTDEELRALYSACHALVFPSTQEGFGWPVIEAQACGAPVLCSEATSLPEVAGGGAIFCDPRDVEGFAGAVRSLASAETRRSLVQRGFENLARFTPESMTRGYSSLYQALLQ